MHLTAFSWMWKYLLLLLFWKPISGIWDNIIVISSGEIDFWLVISKTLKINSSNSWSEDLHDSFAPTKNWYWFMIFWPDESTLKILVDQNPSIGQNFRNELSVIPVIYNLLWSDWNIKKMIFCSVIESCDSSELFNPSFIFESSWSSELWP